MRSNVYVFLIYIRMQAVTYGIICSTGGEKNPELNSHIGQHMSRFDHIL